MPQFRLDNPIQAYPWGHPTRLAELQGRAPAAKPGAELWLGAHPSAPSLVLVGEDWVRMDDFLAASGTELPFLLKILAIGKPLSIQVHPNPEQALKGFEADEASGRAVGDPQRSYKDPYAKPEVVVALEPMRLLVGVKSHAELAQLRELGLDWLGPFLGQGAKELVSGIFGMSDAEADEAYRTTIDVCRTAGGVLGALVDELDANYRGDRGLLVAVCMNLIQLAPGESVFTPDGVLHAYLSGLAVEIMNPSDNVLRAGLTTKHIDVPELVRVLRDEQGRPAVRQGATRVDGGDEIPLWKPEVSLSRHEVNGQTRITLSERAILLVTVGTLQVVTADGVGDVAQGHGLLVTDEESITVRGTGQLFVASC